MGESAQIAASVVQANAARYGIDPDYFRSHNLHIHVPEGAVPKDGPSAGITLATALVSAATRGGKGQKIKAQVPLSELHRYSTSLRSMTQGKASHHREFSHYEIVPHEQAHKLIAEAEAAREEES